MGAFVSRLRVSMIHYHLLSNLKFVLELKQYQLVGIYVVIFYLWSVIFNKQGVVLNYHCLWLYEYYDANTTMTTIVIYLLNEK